MGGRMGMEWNLKKLANFFKFSSCVLKKPQANYYGLLSLLNFICYLCSYAGAFLVQLKVLSNDFSTELTSTQQIAHDSAPLRG